MVDLLSQLTIAINFQEVPFKHHHNAEAHKNDATSLRFQWLQGGSSPPVDSPGAVDLPVGSSRDPDPYHPWLPGIYIPT